jgi:predicted metal-dependent hydrolase
MPPYTLQKSARAKRLRISVLPGGEVRVTVPRRVPLYAAEAFVRAKQKWLLGAVARMKSIAPKKQAGGTRAEFLKYKEAARALARERLAHFNAFYGFDYQKISIRNQKTRWGSCSKDGNLSFNYQIVLLPAELSDYIIVHELCHTRELNHSPAFWLLVARAVPEYKHLRAALKRGYALAP